MIEITGIFLRKSKEKNFFFVLFLSFLSSFLVLSRNPLNRITMSWQAYVDTNLVGTGKIQQAAIIGHDGNTWATSKGFAVDLAEGKKAAGAFANPADIISGGIMIAKQKYLALRYDNRSIYGKKGPGGVVMVKTKQAVLIAVYGDGAQPGEVTSIVEKLADYLIGVNY